MAALIEGDRERSLALVSELMGNGCRPLDIVSEGIEVAMAALDRKCTAEQFNLLEIMLAGRAVVGVIHQLFPADIDIPDPRTTVVTAVLEGDIHDIGKSILKILLAGSRVRVVDCGKDASVASVVQAVRESGASALCISGLISSIVPLVRTVRPALVAAGLGQVRVLAGGAALKQCSAEALDVDYVGQTAFDAVHYIGQLPGVADAAH
ncbi:MAG: B12-binding domain-containing protein [Actinomycetota bacterium]